MTDLGNMNAITVIKRVCEYTSTPRGCDINPLLAFLQQYTSTPKLKQDAKKAITKHKNREEQIKEKKREEEEA